MHGSNFNLKNIPPKIMDLQKKEAAKQKTSLNSLIIQTIEQSFGLARPQKKAIYHDLDHLAGTWSDEDKKMFDNNIKVFESIDGVSDNQC